MLRIVLTAIVFVSILLFGATTQGQKSSRKAPSHYLFVWAGDAGGKESDFLAVIDVEPNSKRYGRIVTTLPIGVSDTIPHHIEHEMPAAEYSLQTDSRRGALLDSI